MDARTVQGYYGSEHTPCRVFCYGLWYVVEGSCNINFTFDAVESGVNIEELQNADTFTWPDGIDSEETLVRAVEA